MKSIKKIYLGIACLFMLVNFYQANAQDIITNSYPGTWHYQNGNELFIVKIWQEGTTYKGHYKMLSVNSGDIIYTSRKSYGNTVFPPTIIGYANATDGLSGSLCDNTIIGLDEDCREGKFQMKLGLYTPGCNNCTITATWKVSDTQGLKVGSEPNFSVPVNVTLIKVSNYVFWDD